MKIGLVRRGYSPTGGAENYLSRLADALEAAGHKPVLMATADWPRDRWPAHRDRVVVDANSPRSFANEVGRLAPSRCDRLFSLERIWRCDCYRAGDGVHRAWLARRGVAEAPWRSWVRHLRPKHRQILALERSLFADDGAGRIIANSELVRDEIVRWYGTSPARIDVVYNGLPRECFGLPTPEERTLARSALQLRENDYAVLFAGSGWERKGLLQLLAAVKVLPVGSEACLFIAGRGNARPYLREMSTQTRARTRFLGPVGDLRALYAAADVFVAPTLYDPFSNACLEALARGLPVLTTSANGFSEIIESGQQGGIFTPSPGGEELASLLVAWSDATRRQQARPSCVATAERYPIETNVARTLQILTASAAL